MIPEKKSIQTHKRHFVCILNVNYVYNYSYNLQKMENIEVDYILQKVSPHALCHVK